MPEPFLFRSSRGEAPACAFGQAVLQGLAPDGGLYVPLSWPRFTVADFAGDDTLPAIASRLLAPFLAEDVLATQLAGIAREALDRFMRDCATQYALAATLPSDDRTSHLSPHLS